MGCNKISAVMALLMVALATQVEGQAHLRTQTLKMVQQWETQPTSPLKPVKQPNSAIEFTGATSICVRGLHAFYTEPNFKGAVGANGAGVMRSYSPTAENCLTPPTSLGTVKSSRALGNFDFTKNSITVWSTKDFLDVPLINASAITGTSSMLVPGPGITAVPIGSVVTTGIGYRYFFSSQKDFYSSTYVTCIDTVATNSDNRFFVQDFPTAPPVPDWKPEILAVGWCKGAKCGPPGMAAPEVAKLNCFVPYDPFSKSIVKPVA